MTKFYKGPDEELTMYRVDDDGKLFELDIIYGTWDDVSDHQDFSSSWVEVTEEYVDAFRLFIYVEQSNIYFQKHKEEVGINEYTYGDDYKFYITNDGVEAVDDTKRVYLCTPKIMLPRLTTIDEIPEDWAPLELEYAIDYIENQEGVFMSDMDMYFDEDKNVIGYLKDGRQFKLDVKSGELNEIYERIEINPSWEKCSIGDPLFDEDHNEILLSVKQYKGLTDLHEYIKRSEEVCKEKLPDFTFGKQFKYVISLFDKPLAIDENEIVYEMFSDHMEVSDKKFTLNSFIDTSRFYIVEQAQNYEKRKKELETSPITLRDMTVLSNENHEILGYTEDGTAYYMDINSGNLIKLDKPPFLDSSWNPISRGEAIVIQGIVKDIARNKIKEDDVEEKKY